MWQVTLSFNHIIYLVSKYLFELSSQFNKRIFTIITWRIRKFSKNHSNLKKKKFAFIHRFFLCLCHFRSKNKNKKKKANTLWCWLRKFFFFLQNIVHLTCKLLWNHHSPVFTSLPEKKKEANPQLKVKYFSSRLTE